MKMPGRISSATQSPAAARPSSDGGWCVVFPPAVGTHNPRSRETTRVTPFANLHIDSFANSLKFSFSAKERDTETGLSYFGARYYSSDLSIWLSVDPMSGKYPSLSPYTYCADNPVKLVDPNGETWETPKDKEIADQLINYAENQIRSNIELIKDSEKDLKKGKINQEQHDDFVNDLKEQNELLREGIQGLQKMEIDKRVFHFNIDDSRSQHNVTKVDKKVDEEAVVVININVNDMINIQWHECIHVIDYLNEPTEHEFNDVGFLGSKNSNLAETHAYRSEWSFYHDKERFPKIIRLYDINDSFIQKRKEIDREWKKQ